MSTLQIFAFAAAAVVVISLFAHLIGRSAYGNTIPGPPLTGDEDGRYEVIGKRVTCSHCGHDQFKMRETLLNTWFLSLVSFEWLDPSASALICQNCGKLTWFSQKTTDKHRGDGV